MVRMALALLAFFLAGCAGPAGSPAEPLPLFSPAALCPGHWHAGFDLYVEGERVDFPKPPYLFESEGGKLPHRMHMHSGQGNILHFSPDRPACLSVRDTFALLDVVVEPERIVLQGNHAAPGEWEAKGHAGLQAYLEVPGTPWTEYDAASALAAQLPDGSRLLLVFGPADADLTVWQELVPQLP
ncbi:MAG TPA: hypothetical protein VI796_06285 [Candidatus Thermoplasmatota archaeon]|nr:hypothetical protein [Candidatus Thermoplasmatota archaeon]